MSITNTNPPVSSNAPHPAGEVSLEHETEGHNRVLNLAAIGSSLALLGLSRLLFNLVGHQSFGLELVGRANVLLALAMLVGLPSSAGLSMAIARFVPILNGPAEIRKTVRVAVLLSLVTSVLILIPSALVSDAWRHASTRHSDFLIAALWSILYAVYSVGRALLFARARARSVLGLEALGFALFGLALMCAIRWHAAWWLPFAVYPLPVSVSVLWTSVGHAPDHSRIRQAEFLRFAALALLGSVAGQGVQYGSTLVGGASGGASLAGTWATLVSLASPMLLLPRSLSTAYLPRLSALSIISRDRFESASREHHRLAALLAVPATGAMLLAGLIGPRWMFPSEPGVDTLLPWLLLCFLTYATSRAEPVLTGGAALGYAGPNAAAATVGGGLCALLWFLLPARMSVLVAIAVGLLVYAIVVPFIALFIIRTRAAAIRPRFDLQPGDFAIAFALLVVLALRGSATAQIIGISITALGALLQWRTYRANRQPRRATP